MIFSDQAKHANGEHSWGIDGETGKVVDMKEYGLYESASVKVGSFALSWCSHAIVDIFYRFKF